MPRGKKKVSVSSSSDTVEKTKIDSSGNELATVEIKTKEQSTREARPVIEKSKDAEKDTAPVIIVSWNDTGGKRHTRTYTCSEVKLNIFKSETLQRSGKKTNLQVSIEAEVLEESLR